MHVGLPRDPAQWLAVGLGVVAWLGGGWLVGGGRRRERAVVFLAAVAALLGSAGYVVVYLRGGPRVIDATSYWLEARAIAAGHLAWPLSDPAAATMGRFLIRATTTDGTPTAAVVFPPGWPAVLALGFLARAPLLVGPVLGAALVVSTAELGRCAARAAGVDGGCAPRIAALLSASCAALRYHTADTMSHGLAATCATVVLLGALRGRDALPRGTGTSPAAERSFATAWFALSGGAMGLLLATRPFSAVALALPVAVTLVAAGTGRVRAGAIFALAALPGVVLLLAHQRAATGVFGASSQALYYAVADGPPGCFRWGFGAGVGCVGEHGDFVRARLPEGYGALAAIGTTLRRLRLHALDFANGEPLFVLVPLAAAVHRRAPVIRILAGACVAGVLAYTPFYFDGSYPGGGARLCAELLPIEHALVAGVAAAELSRRGWPARLAASLPALALFGFGVRAGFDHALLRDREGGRPMFEPSILANAGVAAGLVFVDTDHGFNLAAEPWRRDGALSFARWRGDLNDRLEWEARGRPPALRYRYRWQGERGGEVSVDPVDLSQTQWRIEGESLWPVAGQREAFALPEHAVGTCASADRWLALRRLPGVSPAVTVALPQMLGANLIAPRMGPFSGAAHLELRADGVTVGSWHVAGGAACADLAAVRAPATARTLELHVGLGAVDPEDVLAVDAISVGPPATP